MTTPVLAPTTNDPQYARFLTAVATVFAERAARDRLFTVDAAGLFDVYLGAFGADERQHYTCHACRHFIERYGGLVTVNDSGTITSALFDPLCTPSAFASVAAALMDAVERRPIVASAAFDDMQLGTPQTGEWHHLAVRLPSVQWQYTSPAIVRERHHMVARALAEFTPATLTEALRILNADALSRAERFIGPVQWLLDRHTERVGVKDGRRTDALLWRAVAAATEGFCHPRASVVGTLLVDIAEGKPFSEINARWIAMLHPLRYQRPQAPPKAGAIDAAERLVESLGLARSFARRFARLDECETVWMPRAATQQPATGGMFSALRTPSVTPSIALPPQTMTWEKFVRTVLPTAERLQLRVPAHGNFCALTTAEHADAPPIVRWGNPVTPYVYHGGSHAIRWNLSSAAYHDVTAVVPLPNLWGDAPQPHHGIGIVLTLAGAVDLEPRTLALFPETLRDDLHGVRAVVEAYSNRGALGGREQASACGLAYSKTGGTMRLRVTAGGHVTEYTIDRWD